ncbi:lysophospholipase catalytic domain-containing protein [Melampsora americana]|nr:lysophospholipase catalytic domain-containing protein [Melampsora americana]
MRASIFVISVFTVGNLFVHHSFILSLKIPNPSTSTIFNRRWLSKRDEAIPTSPSGGYAPSRQPCPTSLQVRQPSVEGPLNANELEYVNQKSSKSIPLWKDYLSNVGLIDFDLDLFLSNAKKDLNQASKSLPNFGFAMSGGGARAGLVGAGVLNGFDGRNPEAQRMKTGGLLQLANYAAGLSGGSWLLGSWATSNFPRFTSLNQTVWKLTEPDAIYDLHILKQIDRDLQTATEKAKAGFETSIVDAWAQLIVDHTINTTNNANAVLLSSVRNLTGYATHYAPFIIVTATSRAEGKGDMTLDNPVYEFTPEEFGTWHPSLNAFIPVEFLGTKINQGQLSRGDQCVVGFDSMGFIMATSSNVFSLSSKTDGQPFFIALAHKFLNALAQNVFDESIIPNPFRGLGLGYGLDNGYPARDDENLYLADSSLSGETLPLWPLIQPSRNLDAIIAVDSANRAKPSLNIHAYPNGTSLYASYAKTLGPDYEAYSFPQVPDPYEGEFSRRGYNKRPVFFGCNEQKGALIIYLPNYFIVARTDAPTAQMQFRHTELDGYFSNGFAIATQSKDSSDELSDTLEDNLDRTGVSDPIEWSACLACALIDRQQKRNGMNRTNQCQSCFDIYCAIS